MEIFINGAKQGAEDLVRFLTEVQNGSAVITCIMQNGESVNIGCKGGAELYDKL